MPVPVLAFFPWLIGAFGSALGALFTWFAGFLALRIAARFAMVAGYVLAVATITATVAIAVKAIVYGAQMAMPLSLGAATYFLPNNINVIIGAYVSMRVTYYLAMWLKDRVTAIARLSGGVL